MLLMLSLILAACGGGSGELDSTPATPATAAATTSTPAVATDNDFTCNIPDFEAEFLALVNAARAQGAVCGEGTLRERIHSTGYQYEEASENLAGGQATAPI